MKASYWNVLITICVHGEQQVHQFSTAGQSGMTEIDILCFCPRILRDAIGPSGPLGVNPDIRAITAIRDDSPEGRLFVPKDDRHHGQS